MDHSYPYIASLTREPFLFYEMRSTAKLMSEGIFEDVYKRQAKGLLSLMLSLPDDWNYNMQGLATLSRDGIDSVRSAIKELEHHGYVERHRLRNEYGFYGDTEYIIREVPLGEEND